MKDQARSAKAFLVAWAAEHSEFPEKFAVKKQEWADEKWHFSLNIDKSVRWNMGYDLTISERKSAEFVVHIKDDELPSRFRSEIVKAQNAPKESYEDRSSYLHENTSGWYD